MCEHEEDVILLSDEEGNEVPFQIIDTLELADEVFAILAPLEEDEDEGILIFRILEDEDGQQFEQMDDEDIVQRVLDVYRSSDEDYEFCDAE